MKRVEERLNYLVAAIKNNIYLEMTKYMLKTDGNSRMMYIKYSVLYSWFKDINSYSEFKSKYDSFIKLLNDQGVVDLFDIVKDISADIRPTDINLRVDKIIKDAKRKYLKTTSSEEYLTTSSNSGYKLPNSYLNSDSYLDYSLHRNIMFVSMLRTYLIHVDKFLETEKNKMKRYDLDDSSQTVKGK